MKSCFFLCALSLALATGLTRADEPKSIYVIPRKIKATSMEDARKIREVELESIEIRFHVNEARTRKSLYFEAIHHKPGHKDSALGGRAFTVRRADGTNEIRKGLSYDDYQYSTGLLKRDFDTMWGEWIYARNGASILAAGGSIYLMYSIANFASKREVLALSFLATQMLDLYRPAKVQKIDKFGKVKTVLRPTIGMAIAVYPTYVMVKEIYNFYNET